MKRPRTPEKDIQKAILDWLKWAQIVHVRVQLAGTIGTRRDGSKFMMANEMTGFPDIMFIYPDGRGRLGVIECKAKGGRLSAAQADWRNKLVTAGVQYILAYSLDDVLTHLPRGASKERK